MGEEEDVSVQDNGFTVDLQEEKKDKEKKKKKNKKKVSVDGGELKQGKKRKAGYEDLVTDVEMCFEKEKDKDGGMGEEEDVSVQENGFTADLQEEKKDKEKKKKKKETKNKKKKKDKKTKLGKGEKEAENSTAKRSSKRVSFADNIEVFDEAPKKKTRPLENGEGMVQGKRYSPEEDDMIREAISKYIEEHNLGENGLDMILNCGAHKEIRRCWKEIAESLPHRPHLSICYRAHVLYERADTHEWTDEDIEYVKEFYKKHGSDWKTLAKELNRHRLHVKEAWRRTRLENEKHGRWSQKEYQTLFDLVNKDLSMRALEERKSKHGMLRDNIPWDSISDNMATRHTANCCAKWYKSLTSPMVIEGLWSDTDDYRLVNALLELDASNIEEVMWDYLLEHRDGEVTRKRWKQMVKHIGDYSKLSFSQQVEVLGQRYSPEFIPAREEFDSKPFVDC